MAQRLTAYCSNYTLGYRLSCLDVELDPYTTSRTVDVECVCDPTL